MKSIKQREQMKGYMRDTNFFQKRKPMSKCLKCLNFFCCFNNRK